MEAVEGAEGIEDGAAAQRPDRRLRRVAAEPLHRQDMEGVDGRGIEDQGTAVLRPGFLRRLL
ncbi:hypothetical protein D3C71_1918070 [compost metagenome]